LGSGNLVSESVPKLKIGETENWLGVLMQGANYCGDGVITALLTEMYRFNPNPAPTRSRGSERMERIKYMAASRGSLSKPQRTAFILLIILFLHKKEAVSAV
jgi:hypothetical protein